MPLHASWVHGNTVTIETPQSVRTPQGRGSSRSAPGRGNVAAHGDPDPGHRRRRPGPGAEVLPPPVDGVGAKITEVHLWDGLRRVHEETTTLRGDHSAISSTNTLAPSGRHVVSFGTSISFLARATNDNHGGHSFNVFSTGADFST